MNREEFNQLAKCNCGIKILSPEVKIKNQYTLFGWFLWSQGSTVIPKKMSFICTRCNNKFYETKNKEIIKKYMEINPY
jgi:hypothetical protein